MKRDDEMRKNETRLNLVGVLDSPTYHADLVEVQASVDGVTLNFIQWLPEPEVNSEGINARLVSRVHLAWTHFARVTSLFSDILANNRDQAKKDFMDLLFSEKNG